MKPSLEDRAMIATQRLFLAGLLRVQDMPRVAETILIDLRDIDMLARDDARPDVPVVVGCEVFAQKNGGKR